MLPRIAEWQIAMVAAARMGAVPIPCITMLTASDLAYRVEHSGAAGVICLGADTAKFDGLDTLTTRVAVDLDDPAPDGWASFADAHERSPEFEAATVAADDPAVLYYTSGSTGSPKGVTHAARSLWAWSNSAIHWLGLSPQERIWCTADTGWSNAGTSILFGPWSQGASVLFYNGPFVPAERFGLLERFEVTCFCAAATELRRLILEDTSGFDLSKLRSTVSAGESASILTIGRSSWFATGDNVEIDDEGYVFYTGRADDIIGSAGYRIGPQEVENALVRHPAVQECAVVGVPDDDRGQIVKAWVVLAEGHVGNDALVTELQTHTKQTTAPYKYPRAIAFTDELPKTVTGKIRRNVLREHG